MKLSASQTLSVFFPNLEERPVARALGERLMTQFLVPGVARGGGGVTLLWVVWLSERDNKTTF